MIGDEKIPSFRVETIEPLYRIGDIPIMKAGSDELLRRQSPIFGEDVVDFPFADGTPQPIDHRSRRPTGQSRRFIGQNGTYIYLRHFISTKLYSFQFGMFSAPPKRGPKRPEPID